MAAAFPAEAAQRRRRGGFTLLELAVVIVILIALASIVVGLLPNILTKSQSSSAASSVSDLNRAVQTYYDNSLQYPNNLDNLVDATSGSLLGTLAVGINGPINGHLQAGQLTAPQAAALSNSGSGMTSVASLSSTAPAGVAWSPTFFPYTTSSPSASINTTALQGGTHVAMLSQAGITAINQKFGASTTGTYVVFGFGSANSAVGQVVLEPPTYFTADNTNNPALTYQRYGLIFKVADSASSMTTASYVGAVCLLSTGIASAGDNLQSYYTQH